MNINIEKTSDWNKLREQNLNTVVDPMVIRCGEIFLQGAKNIPEQNKDNTWNFLNANLLAIGSFFDALILNEKIPAFNYEDTFDPLRNFDAEVLKSINSHDEILYRINVG